MENWIPTYFTWPFLAFIALVLWGFYALLVYLRNRLQRSSGRGGWRRSLLHIVAGFLLVYEPFTILTLAVIFLFVNPLPHAVLLLILFIAGFSRIKEYFSGRILLFSPLIRAGKRMTAGKHTGVISRIGRLGLYLQTGEGLHFVNYSNLLSNGYSIVKSKEVGGFYSLNITTPDREEQAHPIRYLENKFISTPFLNRAFKPELSPGKQENRVKARISVREEKHLRQLLKLLDEWGYPATIAGK